jgi:hypothetical protein
VFLADPLAPNRKTGLRPLENDVNYEIISRSAYVVITWRVAIKHTSYLCKQNGRRNASRANNKHSMFCDFDAEENRN